LSIDYIINKIISLDPHIEVYLQPLAHKVIHINCQQLPITDIYCSFTDKYLQISALKPEHIDTFITWTLNKTTVNGDVKVAHNLQQLLSKLKIDWEEELSKYTGDAVAHQSIYLLKQLRQYQQQASTSLEEMITEYLQEESGLLPTKYEIDEFMQAVDVLRLDTDRITAKVEAYENN